MKKTNKILSIILAILMIISIVPITSSAVTYSGTCGDNATWTYDSSTYTLTISGIGDMYDYKSNNRPWENYEDKIKTVLINDGITTIGTYAFYSFGKVASITIPKSVIEIGKSAFSYCKKLINITLPNGITTIENNVFAYCESLTTVTIPDEVTTIENEAFAFCESLTNITIPYGVTTIGNDVFFACNNLTNITIPATVTLIGDEAFQCCENLTKIAVDSENQYYSSDEYGVLFNKNKTILIICPDGSKESFYRIPDSVLTIEAWAFRNCYNLEQVIIPDSVTTIGEHAFYLCSNLIDVKIGNGVTDISDWVFGECDSLVTVTIPDSVTRIGNYAFYWCDNITNVIFGKNVTSIGLAAFNECTNITDVYYSGTKNQWENIIMEDGNDTVVKATKHYNSHIHKYSFVVTTEPTCINSGVITFTCSTCYDTYTSAIKPLGHSYISEITTPVTHTATGVMTYTCDCGDTYTETIEKNEKHNYESVVTAPTCTEQGYTTYACECNDSYVGDYVDALGHTEETIPAVAPTCTETGLTEGAKCSACGETLTEQKELPENGHTPAEAIEENYVAPTCTENGSRDVVVYCSVCTEEISRETETLDATGHADNDEDGYCDADNELLDPSVECDHACHKGGISGFIWKIINFFNKLLGLNNTCSCGVAHY